MPAKASTARKINWYPEERLAWTPPERLLISEWSEKYRVLTEPAEEKGPLRLRRTPYLVPIMDCMLDPSVEQVVFCKSAQIAGTECMLSVVGYFSHQEPCPIMVILADEDTANYMSRERIQKMFSSSPELSRLIIPELFNRGEITLVNGTYIALGWASSVAKLASRPIRVVVFDEVDKPGYYVTTKEAGPISLGIERTETFYGRKIAILSTPTTEEGNIWRQLHSCDAIFDWHVPCPYCGQLQPLRWSREHAIDFPDGKYRAHDGTVHDLGMVVWEGGKDATPEQIERAGYQCGECGNVWSTIEKSSAIEKGMMVSRSEITHPPKKVGFHINRLYSLLGKSGDIPKLVDEWIRCGDPREKQGFINSTLAEPWKQVIVTTSEAEVLKARCDLPPQTVPQDAVALTCGIDVQKYGFWFAVRAWARDFTSWLIHYGHLATWEDVENLLFKAEYPVDGMDLKMRMWRAALDTGGGDYDQGMSSTEQTYWWLRRNAAGRGCRCWGTKGASSPLSGKIHVGKPLDKTPSGKPIPGGLQIVLLDTNKLKDTFHYRLEQAMNQLPQSGYLHAETDNVYVSHILAEEKRKDKRGIEEWVQVKKDNHLLDADIIAHALADPEWPGGGVHLLGRPQQPGARSQGGERDQRMQGDEWLRRTPEWLRR